MNRLAKVHPAMDQRRVVGSELGNDPDQHRGILKGQAAVYHAAIGQSTLAGFGAY
jgi:hypothetical protein